MYKKISILLTMILLTGCQSMDQMLDEMDSGKTTVSHDANGNTYIN